MNPADTLNPNRCNVASQSYLCHVRLNSMHRRSRMHTKAKNRQYPVKCKYCEAKLENETFMKEHLKIHVFKKSTFKCKDCEFCGENFLP